MFVLGKSRRVVAVHFVEKVEKSASKCGQNVQNPLVFPAENEGFAPKTDNSLVRDTADRLAFFPGFTEEKLAAGRGNQNDGALQNLKQASKTRGFRRLRAVAKFNSLSPDRACVFGENKSTLAEVFTNFHDCQGALNTSQEGELKSTNPTTGTPPDRKRKESAAEAADSCTAY